MVESRLQQNLAARALLGFLLQLVLRLRGLLLIPIVLRAMPPSEVGVLNLGNSFVGWMTPLLLLGINTGFALRVVHLTGSVVRPAVLTVLSFATAVSIVGTLVVLAAVDRGFMGVALAPLIPVLIPLGLLAIGTATREVATVFPQIRQDLRFIGQNSILMDFGGVLLAIALVLSGFGAYGAILGPAVMSLAGATLAGSYSLRHAEGPWSLDRVFLTRALRAALPVVPWALALWTLRSSDYFFVSYFRGTAAVAIYGLAYNLASPTLMAMAAMNLTYLPTCVEILGRGRLEFAKFIDNSTRLFAIGGIAVVGFSVVAGPGVTAWFAGPAYAESGRLLPVVVAAYVLLSLAQLQQFVPGAMTQNLSGAAWAYAWAAGLNIVANFVLVPRYGYWGAAWATLASYALALLLLVRSVRELLPEMAWPRMLGRLTILAIASSGVALLLRPFARGAIAGVGLGLVSLLAVAVLALAFGCITRADLARWRPTRPENAGRELPGSVTAPMTAPPAVAGPRVAMVVSQFWPVVGGAENQALRLSGELRKQGLAVEIWTGRWSARGPAIETVQGVAVRRLGSPVPLPLKRLERYAFMIALFVRLLRRRRDYDLIHVQQVLYPAFVAACAARFVGRPCIAQLRSTGVTCDFTVHARGGLGVQRALTRRLLTRIVTLSRQGEADSLAHGYRPTQIVTLPNGVSVSAAIAPRPVRDPVRVLYVGGLRPEKRVDLLLEAWLGAGYPGRLVIVGEGSERVRLQPLAAGCGDRVEFAGQIADPTPFYAAADVFVLSSDAEGMSNAMLEAMAAGCACVATWVGGNIDLLGPEQQQPPPPGGFLTASAGLLVRTGDAVGLALALTTLCGSAPLRKALAAAAHQRCLSGYSLAGVAGRYRQLYAETLAGTTRADR